MQRCQSALAAIALIAAGSSAGLVNAQALTPALTAADREANPTPLQLTVGEFKATRPLSTMPSNWQPASSPSPITALGDTFDAEVSIWNAAFTAGAFICDITDPLSNGCGQSVLYDSFFNPAGASVINGADIEIGGDEVLNPDGTYSIIVAARIDPLSDGFLPLAFSVGGDPAENITFAFGGNTLSDRDSAPDSLDLNLDTEFPPAGDFELVAVDIFFFDNGVLLGSGSFIVPPVILPDLADFIDIIGAAGANIDEIVVQYTVQSPTADTTLTLAAEDDCLNATENQLVVEINAALMHDLAVGGQFFLDYDNTLLDFVSIDPGDFPFDTEVFEVVDEAAGTIDYAVGVTAPDPGTAAPTTMARITFNTLADFCFTPDLVTFRPATIPPSRITNDDGIDLGAILIDLAEVTKDSVAPTITPPADIVVDADAGGCTAVLNFTEPFDSAVPIGPSQAPGIWYTDRFPPAAFESAFFDNDNRLLISISEDDSAANRPPNFSGGFYDTQGRKYDVDIPVGQKWSADLYIDSGWATQVRRSDIWATTFNSFNNISGFPILGFVSNDPGDTLNPSPANPEPRFRFFTQDIDQDPSTSDAGWIELGLPPGFSYDRWWTLEIELTPTGYNYAVIDDTNAVVISGTDTFTFGSIRAGNIIMQAFNFAEDYDVYWDNITLGPEGPIATDDCSNLTISFERSDDPLLTLQDPFPQGNTTVTWTATDECGNSSSVDQLVTVVADNVLEVTVELANVSEPGPFTRCIEFDLVPTNPLDPVVTVSQTLTFNNGIAVASVDIPCGDYSCIAARDPLHTLRATDNDDFVDAGTIYLADFTDDGINDNDALQGGNLNGDTFIDILDFGLFVSQFNTNVGADTDCNTTGPHADINGDGFVLTADFTFIQNNFLLFDEALCGSTMSLANPEGIIVDPKTQLDEAIALGMDIDTAETLAKLGVAPVASISVEQLLDLGMDELIQADLNNDSILSADDVAAFLAGNRPTGIADLDGNNIIDAADLSILLGTWGTNNPTADINADGTVDAADLGFLLARFGMSTN